MTVNKIFISEFNEEKWLNKLGSKGYLLTDKSIGKYTFKKIEKKVTYCIDYLDEAPQTPDNAEYLKNKSVCGFKGNSAYISDEEHTVESLSRQSARYGKLSAFFGVILALFAALFVYNLRYVSFFKSIDYVVPADKNEILSIFNFVVGKNPAILFMWLLAAIITVLALITAIFAHEWLSWSKRKDSLKKLQDSAEQEM